MYVLSPIRIFLTGLPGCGKTTIIKNVIEKIGPHLPISGFFTSEIRTEHTRVGFSITTTDGKEGILAHINFKSKYKVGRYGVDLAGFERIVLPCLLGKSSSLYVIDEIGKMECLSLPFCTAVRELLSREIPIIGTIALRGGGIIAEVKARKDIQIWEVTPANRDTLPMKILEKIEPFIKKQ
ncbi:MAG: NTPase [Syntrophales bacterium]|nr:NTPase [Syntrophales bacterium]